MSALMAERRDWAEDPRQASLFDALAPPREQPAEPGRVVEFPKRGDVAPAEVERAAESSAPTHPDGLEGAPSAASRVAADEAATASAASATAAGFAPAGVPAP